MKIAVTYENGEVFQHFGRTPAFKVYEVSDGKVQSSEVIDTNGTEQDTAHWRVSLRISEQRL